ncbi:hypothetical protein GJAV_G00183940 [Gymnothorax javanicus]|nr:hypothetical protein GJAV_G00183940 [Gymnothorax javanicus]
MSLSDTEVAIIEKAVQEPLEQIEKNAPEEYAKLNADPGKKKAVTEAARNAATERVKPAKGFAGRPDDITKGLAEQQPQSRIMMLRKELEFPTFRIYFTMDDDGEYWVVPTRRGKARQRFVDIDWAKIIQHAMVMEAVALVMSAVGISVSPSAAATEQAIEEVAEAIRRSTKLQRALDAFVEAWNNHGGETFPKAKAIFQLLKDTYAADLLWTIIKDLCSNMAWYDWLETADKVTATIIPALATEGVALIAEIALIVSRAVYSARKIANLIQLKAIKI